MREYGFSPTRVQFCPYTGEHGSVKTRIPAYFMQCTDNDSLDCRGEEGEDCRYSSLPSSQLLAQNQQNRNTKKRCEMCSKLTIKTPERRQ